MRSLILILFLLVITFYLGQSKIEKIDCQINQTPCTEEIKKEFDDFLGKNFFFFNPQSKIREIKATFPHWKKIETKKIPFKKMAIKITTRQPVACLLIGEKIFLLDKEAVVLNEVKVNPGLPEIETDKYQQETIKKALEVISLLDYYSISFQKIKVNQDKLIIFLPQTEVFVSFQEIPLKIASLQMVISQSKIKEKLPKKIDLRFKKPVIIY